MVSGTDASLNYVQLPMDTWSMTDFTIDDYKDLVRRIEAGIYNISTDTANMPATKITVTTQANIH